MERTRFEPIQIVKNKLNEKKIKSGNDLDEITKQRLEFISNMLNNERCFFELKKSIAIEILSFLDFEEEEIFELYDKLIDYESFKGNFEFINMNNQMK